LEAGKHVYPFTFKLPLYAPSSFKFSGADENRNYISAEIEYVITAKLKTVSGAKVIFEDSRKMNVRNRNANGKASYEQASNHAVKGCCVSKGITAIKF
jgi:hypothetical protein